MKCYNMLYTVSNLDYLEHIMTTFLPSRTQRLIGYLLSLISCVMFCGVIAYLWLTTQPLVPIYPQAQEVDIKTHTEATTNDGTITASLYVISFWTKDSPPNVISFYQTALERDGWQLTQEPKQVEQGSYVYIRDREGTRRQGLTFLVGLTERPGLYLVTLSMGNYEQMRCVHMFEH